ncbi:MAG: TlpA family protein disulfide reductase [Weeksellaceae bacterium]
MIKFIKKRWADVLIGVFILLMLLPQTRMPVQVFIQRLISFSPNTISKDKQEKLLDYSLTFSDQENNVYSLENDKGKVIVINFWATWCPPCVAEMPSFSNLYQDYKDDVSFYFITQDEWSRVNTFEDKRNYALPYYQLLKPSDQLQYTSLPTTYVIGKEGNILINKVGVADWESDGMRSFLDQALSE